MTKFSDQLEEARIKANLSKNQLIEKSGLSRMMIYAYIKGNSIPTNNSVLKLAKALNISPDYFDCFKINRAIKILEREPELLNEVLKKAKHHREFTGRNVYYVN